MSLRISGEEMSSDRVEVTAHRVGSGWALDWLGGRVVDRNEAVSAMLSAEMAAGNPPVDSPQARLARQLQAELDPPVQGQAKPVRGSASPGLVPGAATGPVVDLGSGRGLTWTGECWQAEASGRAVTTAGSVDEVDEAETWACGVLDTPTSADGDGDA